MEITVATLPLPPSPHEPDATLVTRPGINSGISKEIAPEFNTQINTLAAFDRLYIKSPRRWLIALLLAYLLGGTLFALYTPPWQAPDEPAHFNYVAHIAKTVTLPVLRMGDYNQEKLQNLLQTKFIRRLSPENLLYESYQPPLYYLLATPIYWVSGGSLLALRLFGVFLGALTILLLYFCLDLVFPGKTLIPLGAAAFSALLPMHMAMTAAVTNDGLAELLIVATMLVLLVWMRHRFYDRVYVPVYDRVYDRVYESGSYTENYSSNPSGAPSGYGSRYNSGTVTVVEPLSPIETGEKSQSRQLLWLGVLLGLGLVTKIYAYMLLPLIVAVVVVVTWLAPYLPTTAEVRFSPSRASFMLGLRRSLRVIVPAVLLGLPMWIRNLYLYGGYDILGLAWHDQVVVGQPRTADWIAEVGWISYSERAFSYTFQSFWGVFGWMSVFMDERIYVALLIFTGVIFLGVLWATVRFISGGPDTDMNVFQLAVLILFGLMLILVFAGYVVYNTKFVQHQGRYFFWGLLPISTVVALGWREVLQPLQGAITGFMATVLALAATLSGMVTGGLNKWTILSIGIFALVLLCQPLLLGGSAPTTLRWLPPRARLWMTRPSVSWLLRQGRSFTWALPFILLFLLDLAIPHLFIVPILD